jgi:hypothetical protein
MADKPYKVTFTWSGAKLDEGKLDLVACDQENIPNESHWLKSVSNQWTQLGILNPGESAKAAQSLDNSTYNQLSTSNSEESQKTALTLNKPQTVQLRRSGFLYMDVGCWLKGKQTFGLVWNDQAAICSYYPASNAGNQSTQENLIKRFEECIAGVTVDKTATILGNYPHDDTLYLILPDMHIPESPPLSVKRPNDDGSWKSFLGGRKKMGHYTEDPYAWDELVKHDLFESRKSIDAMITFLSGVAGLSWCNKIALVQLGDMYELWAARPCLLEQISEAKLLPPPAINIKIISNEDAFCKTVTDSIALIAKWIGYTHIIYPDLFSIFDTGTFASKTFLYGNHDSYLIDDRVVKEANTYIKENYTMHKSLLTTVYPRQQSNSQQGIFIEHGQRVDGYNQDGNTDGFSKSNNVILKVPGVGGYLKKNLDSTRRETFVTGAAAMWVSKNASFGLYVQGHTHEAALNYVEVYHKREDITVGADPYGISDRYGVYKSHKPIN